MYYTWVIFYYQIYPKYCYFQYLWSEIDITIIICANNKGKFGEIYCNACL